MPKRILIPALFLLAPLLVAQLDSNSVTVTASRQITLPPDLASTQVRVTAPLSTSIDDILAAVQGTGITIANFSNLYGNTIFVGPDQPPMPVVLWSFQLKIPFSKLKDTLSTLASLKQSLSKKTSTLTLDYSVEYTSTSSTPGCSLADLIADGRAQAQKLATGAGVSVGAVLALSQFVSTVDGVAAPPCSLSIKFALLRY